MTDHNVEDRLETLEQQVRDIVAKVTALTPERSQFRDWRRSLGMFDDHSLMKQVDEEGRRIRQQDREQVADDHS